MRIKISNSTPSLPRMADLRSHKPSTPISRLITLVQICFGLRRGCRRMSHTNAWRGRKKRPEIIKRYSNIFNKISNIVGDYSGRHPDPSEYLISVTTALFAARSSLGSPVTASLAKAAFTMDLLSPGSSFFLLCTL